MNNAFDISNDEILKRSDKSATTEPPPPCDGSKAGEINERIHRLNPLRKTRDRLSSRNTVLAGFAAMICLLPTVTYAQIEAVTLINTFLQLDKTTISSVSGGSIELFRSKASDHKTWQANQCFELLFTSPYADPDVYSSFLDDNPPSCTSTTDGVTIQCQAKEGTHDTLQFFFPTIATDKLDLTSITFQFNGFHTPWSARDLSKIDVRTFSDKECKGSNFQGYQVSAQTVLPGEIDSENCSITSTSDILGYKNADNALVFRFTPGTTLSKSGRGMFRLQIPAWYQVGSKINFMYNVEASNACSSPQMKITHSTPSILDQHISIRYEDMEEEYFSGKEIEIKCTQFFNPIYQKVWMGFSISTFDDEVWPSEIERSEEVGLDATGFVAASISDSEFTIQPSNFEVGTKSTWSIFLNMPIPMETTCYIKIFVPSDLTFELSRIRANGIFSPPAGGSNLSSADWQLNREDTPSPSIRFAGCNKDSDVGQSPSGSLMIDSISTPLSIKDSGNFYVKVYKDVNLEMEIANIQKGVYVEAVNLAPGTVTGITMTAEDPAVQKVTVHTITFVNEHQLDQSGLIKITFPTSLTLPAYGAEMEIIPIDNSIQATVATVQAGNEVRVENVFEGLSQEDIPGKGHTFAFKIVGIQNQRSADDAGKITVQTYIQGSNDIEYKVDYGEADSTFVAVTGNVIQTATIEVIDPVTYGSDSTYILKFICESMVPDGGRIEIYIPEPFEIFENIVTSSGTCASATCLVNVEDRIVEWTITEDILDGSQIQFELKGVRNPRTTQTTGTFFITTRDTNLVSEIDSGYNMATKVSVMGDLSSFGAVPKNDTNGAENTYTFSLQTLIPLLEGDRLFFTIPQQVAVPSTKNELNCLPIEGITKMRCSISGHNIEIEIVELNKNTGTFQWTFDNLKNPSTLQISDKFSNIYVTDKEGYDVARLDGELTTGILNQNEANILMPYSLTQSNDEASELAIYTIKFYPTNSIPSTGSIQLTWPPHVKVAENDGCTISTSADFSNNCLIEPTRNQTEGDSGGTITITNVFVDQANFNNEITVKLAVYNPVNNRPQELGFGIRTYADEASSYMIDYLTDADWRGLLIPHLECTHPCATCTASNAALCESCWQSDPESPAFLMRYEATEADGGAATQAGQCKEACDTGYTTDGDADNVCVECDASCKTCHQLGRVGDRDRCYLCSDNHPYKLVGEPACLAACFEGYFESSEVGAAGATVKKTCSRCDAPCLDCDGHKDHCTACIPGSDLPVLMADRCIEACPAGYTDVAGVCQKCEPPCATCVNTTTTCLSCDGTDDTRFVFANVCYPTCPLGTAPDNTNADNYECIGCLAGCDLCDDLHPDVCLICGMSQSEPPQQLYVWNGTCEAGCPEAWRLNGGRTACVPVTINDLEKIYFPFLWCAAVALLIVFFGVCKKKPGRTKYFSAQNTLTCGIAALAPIQLLCCAACGVWAVLFQTMLFAYAFFGVWLIALITNIVFATMYWKVFNSKIIPADKERKYKEGKLTKKELQRFIYPSDEDFAKYAKKHRCVQKLISILTICTFKYNKLYYSRLYSFDMFKARWSQGKYYRKMMTWYCIVHIVTIDMLLLCITAAGLVQWMLNRGDRAFLDNQFYITLVECFILSFLSVGTGLVELFLMKDCLKYNETGKANWGTGKKAGLFGVSSGAPEDDFLDKESREAMLKNLMNNVKNNKDMFLNNKLDELLQQFGDRRCKSMILFGTGWDKEDDPRHINTFPLTPTREAEYDGEYHFTKDDMIGGFEDNVYAEARKKELGIDEGVQGDQGQQDFMRQLHRKQGDLLAPVEEDDELQNRHKKHKQRGRKNKYYTAIDAEDDEEADGHEASVDVDDAEQEEDNLEVIREQQQEEATLRTQVEEERRKQVEAAAERRAKLAEAERLRLAAEAEGEEARRKSELEEERLRLAQEQEELKRMQELEGARIQMQLEEEEERRQRESDEANRKKELAELSAQNRSKYEAEEAARKRELEEEEARLKREAEEAERRAQETLAEEEARKKEEAERLQAQRDQEQLRSQQEQLERDERQRAEEKEAERLRQEQDDAERRLRAGEEAERKRQAKAEEDRIRKEEEEILRQRRLVEAEETRQRQIQIEEEIRLKRVAEEEERRLKRETDDEHFRAKRRLEEEARIALVEREEAEHRAKMEEDERRRKARLEKEEEGRRERLAQEEKERRAAIDAEEGERRANLEALEAERLHLLKETEATRMAKLEADSRARENELAQIEKNRLKELGDEEAARLGRLAEEERDRKATLDAEEAERHAEAERARQAQMEAHMAKLEAEEKERLAKLEKEEEARRANQKAEDYARERKILEEEEARKKRLAAEEALRSATLAEEAAKRKREEEERLRQIEEEADRKRRELEAAGKQQQAEAELRAKGDKDRLDKMRQEEEERILREKKIIEAERKFAKDERDKEDEQAKLRREAELREMEDRIEGERLEREAIEKEKAELARQQKEAAEKLRGEMDELERNRLLAEAAELERQAALAREREEMLAQREREAREKAEKEEQDRLERERRRVEMGVQAFESQRAAESDARSGGTSPMSGGPPRTAGGDKNQPLSQQSIDKIIEQNEEEGDTLEADNSRIEVTDKLLEDFARQEPPIEIPPNQDHRTFNVNDILGELDRDEKGNIIVPQDHDGNTVDKAGKPTNVRGYLIDPKTGAVLENQTSQIMFDAADLDERGELPAPFCVEKYNFNPHDLMGDLDYDFDQRTNTAVPMLLKTQQGFFVDKKGRRINKHGWLVMGNQGHIVDRKATKKFDRKQLEDQDLPKLFNYSGKRFDIQDLIGVFDKDNSGKIMPVRAKDGTHLLDNLGRRVNEKGYLTDTDGNVIDKNGKRIWKAKELKNGEFPKIFLFTKFNINNITGDFEMSPLTDPILEKDAQGNLIDRKGRHVNPRGYLIDKDGNIIDKRGKRMFDKVILSPDGEIPKVFRTGMLKSDSGSSLSRLMSEIEKNQPSEYEKEEEAQPMGEGDPAEGQGGSGDTSVDSMMEDTPANYNIPNQRFDEYEDYEPIPEEGSERVSPEKKMKRKPPARPQRQVVQAEQELPAKKMKKKKKKPKKKTNMLEYLMPTGREVNMADAYGGAAKGQFRRPGVKYDKERLQNRIKTPANIPGGRAQLEQLASTVAGFNRSRQNAGQILDNLSSRGGDRDRHSQSRPPRAKRNGLVGGNSEMNPSDAGSQMSGMHSRGSRRGLGIDKHQSHSRSNIPDMREKKRGTRTRKGDVTQGDFEKMFGKDIDQFLEESEWDIDSYEKMSQFSKASGRNSQNDIKLKAMEKVYLQRIEAGADKKSAYHKTVASGTTQEQSIGRKKQKPVPKFREFQDRFTDDPDFVHKGQILEFETSGQKSSQKKKTIQPKEDMFRPGIAENNTSFMSQSKMGSSFNAK